MGPAYNSNKPENALGRAKELVSLNKIDSALYLLHEVLVARKYKTWSLVYEAVCLYYLTLCVKEGRFREMKDGLHQYRNMTQVAAPGSLSKVCKALVEMSKAKIRVPSSSDDSSSDKNSILTGDLEDSASPESVLMSTMTTTYDETVAEKRDILPHLKFLWEVYRCVLDILRTSTKLEGLYHEFAGMAFNFCATYRRKTEFRRLCDLLRSHLVNFYKYGATPESRLANANKLKGWEGWTQQSIENHLETRFIQLEVAGNLEQYSEGFRTVEDIYGIMCLDKRPPRAKLMATYYSRLSKVFWVSANFLFNAYATYKHYTLTRDFNKNLGEEERRNMQGEVVLAGLCIGWKGEGEGDQERNMRMATLLGFNSSPSRKAFLSELKNAVEPDTKKSILLSVDTAVASLHSILEENSDPLAIIQNAKPLLDEISTHPTYGKYTPAIRNALLNKFLKLLSGVYHAITIDGLMDLVAPLSINKGDLEAVVYTASRAGLLEVKIDHKGGCIRFGEQDVESDGIRRQLSTLCRSLTGICDDIEAPDEAKEQEEREIFFAKIKYGMDDENKRTLERTKLIEERKLEAERLHQEEVKEKAEKKRIRDEEKKKEQEAKIARDAKMREREKQIKIANEMENTRKKNLLAKLGKNIDDYEVQDLKKLDADALSKEHTEKILKKKDDAERKLKEHAKRLDYTVRAFRTEEQELLKKLKQEQDEKETREWEDNQAERRKLHKAKWEKDRQLKEIFSKLHVFEFMDSFQDKIMDQRRKEHEEAVAAAEAEAHSAACEAQLERARSRRDEEIRRDREEEQRKVREEQERKIQAEQDRIREEERKAQEEKDSWNSVGRSGKLQETSGGGGGGAYRPPARDEGGAPSRGSSYGSGRTSGEGGYTTRTHKLTFFK
ncbi:hypothetical protein TrRE_jg7326 [Triparma retinervis]|uniref:eIF3a PCI domain-containing protein n=1 Tax=Triparma retinervis TaxID=2557542 RepID=A0A9W6ZZW1_9STRA|nr:hypothetical protein TrRE_jg7326 [Triparma retinervis]